MIGEKIIWVATLPSTNDFLKENWHRLPHGTIVVAESQTSGRGRYNRYWYSPEGGLWFSILFKPRKQIKPTFFTKICCVAIVKALSFFEIDTKIKWPNDVYYKDKKLAGILSESVFEESTLKVVVVGIGLNVNNDIPKELKDKATSLREISTKDYDLKTTLKIILKYINQLLRRYLNKPEALTRVWKGLLIQKEGQQITFKLGDDIKTGKIFKIEDEKMILTVDDQQIQVSSLEILEP
ncbi:biotin--[acetyl-CoA-carboxylase] ligase [Thermotoga profunda]|uniref:biotin--[acetyl-CoA-carboxylase] ligase n=1 Tax=Thermotoga profunda TaxID=1508420 RepID=UPI000597745B|nr:biotin--[acetyl-CoA-carboxylase] ligase [Thermotoga profunda]